MLRAGAILLSLWAGLHLAIALAILAMLLSGSSAPALAILHGDLSGRGVEPRALSTINSLAALCNAWRAAMCLLALAAVWGARARGSRWALWSLAGGVCLVQAAGFLSDGLLHRRDLLGDAAVCLVPLAGLALAAAGVFRGPPAGGPARL